VGNRISGFAGCILGLTLLGHMPAARAQEVTAIKAGKIITVSGPEITNGVILIRGGKITAIGANLPIPEGAKVLESPVVMPGMVEAHTSRGMDAPNENVAVVPFVNTADGIDPVSITFEDALRDGITTLHVLPGNATVVGGTGIVIKPTGPTVENMLLKKPGAMKLSLAPSGGRNRMAQVEELRRAFDDFDVYRQQWTERRAEAKKAGRPEEEIDPRQQAMQELVDGKLVAFLYCPTDSDVVRAIELIDARKLKSVLVLGAGVYKTASLIAKKKLSVVLDPQMITWETEEDRDKEVRRVSPTYFHNAGVKYALEVQSSTFGSRYLWYQAAIAVSYGVPRAEALRAITLAPAEMIGVGDRVGSLEVGKDANILLLTGDPLAAKTWVETVLIEGKIAYERKNDTRLQKLLTGKEPGNGN
jgi:imidazolonepropionase-like amidohydrolase